MSRFRETRRVLMNVAAKLATPEVNGAIPPEMSAINSERCSGEALEKVSACPKAVPLNRASTFGVPFGFRGLLANKCKKTSLLDQVCATLP